MADKGNSKFMQAAAKLAKLESCYVRQELTLLEALSLGCCEQKNLYSVYPSQAESETKDRLLLSMEEAPFWTYCCCKPGHSFFLRILDGQEANTMTKDNLPETLVTLERPGCVCCPPLCCLCASPKPFLCQTCFTCGKNCADEIIVHEGDVITEKSEPGKVEAPNVVGMVRQPPCGGGGLHPTFEIFYGTGADDDAEPIANLRGPTCFGGCSEVCCDTPYNVSRGRTQENDFGKVTRVRGKWYVELCTDVDQYAIEFDPSATPEEKLMLVNSVLLADYTFFEFDANCVECTPRQKGCDVWVTCCLCFFYGCLIPCKIPIMLGSDGEGGE